VGAPRRLHEVCRSLLWNWRRQVRRGTLRSDPAPVFLPVRLTGPAAVEANQPLSPAPSRPAPATTEGNIEITLADGTTIRAGHDISLATLRRVMAAVRG